MKLDNVTVTIEAEGKRVVVLLDDADIYFRHDLGWRVGEAPKGKGSGFQMEGKVRYTSELPEYAPSDKQEARDRVKRVIEVLKKKGAVFPSAVEKNLIENMIQYLYRGPLSMGDWRDRLKTEHKELEEKMGKLRAFLNNMPSQELNEENKWLLISQLKAMDSYRWVLERRMKLNGIEREQARKLPAS